MPSFGKPTRDDLWLLVDRLQPKIARLFKRYGVSTAEAERRVAAALIRLSWQWDGVRDREVWLLTELKDGLSVSREVISKEPRNE
jgi:hypothetical protein